MDEPLCRPSQRNRKSINMGDERGISNSTDS